MFFHKKDKDVRLTDKEYKHHVGGTAHKVLLIAPIAMFCSGFLLLIISSIIEMPTHRGTLYSFLSGLSLLLLFISVFPGIIMSIIGTILSVRAGSKGFIVLGIIELLLCAGGLSLLWYAIFVTGQGV